MKGRYRLLFFLTVCLLSGCKTTPNTLFAPFDARFEAAPGGGARYLVLLNTGEKDLHNFTLSTYLWNDNEPNPLRRSHPVKRGTGSGVHLATGRAMRWSDWGKGVEAGVFGDITRLEIVGHCEEGDFRQSWHVDSNGQLRRQE